MARPGFESALRAPGQNRYCPVRVFALLAKRCPFWFRRIPAYPLGACYGGAIDRLAGSTPCRRWKENEKAAIGTIVEHVCMAVERSYTVVLLPEPEVGGFSVSVPALPEIATQGETEEEAMANAREAISLVVFDRAERGEDIPPSDIEAPRFERIAIAV